MKKMTDEEIQQWLDASHNGSFGKGVEPVGDNADAYKILFNVLDKMPLQGLSHGFSARVDRRVQADAKRKSDLRYYLISVAALANILFAIYGLLILLTPFTGKLVLVEITEYKWAFILFVFSLLTIQYLDEILIKANISSPGRK
jgi:hypothetical protein